MVQADSNHWKRFDKDSRPEVRVILKADVQGSLQVVERELRALSGEQVILRIIRTGVGDVVSSDVFLAETTKASILGFNVSTHRAAVPKAKQARVEIRTHDTLQALVEDARSMLEEALPPLEVEEPLGRVEVRKVFKSSKLGNIAGCFVTEGVVRRNAQVRLVRDEIILWQGRLSCLRRFKDDVKEVRENFECGIRLAGRSDIMEGDLLEVIEIKKVKQRLAC